MLALKYLHHRPVGGKQPQIWLVTVLKTPRYIVLHSFVTNFQSERGVPPSAYRPASNAILPLQ